MVIMEVGKTYLVSHSRKGRFTFQVTEINEIWVTGIIVEGVADAIMEYNVKVEGEEITVRASFLKILKEF